MPLEKVEVAALPVKFKFVVWIEPVKVEVELPPTTKVEEERKTPAT